MKKEGYHFDKEENERNDQCGALKVVQTLSKHSKMKEDDEGKIIGGEGSTGDLNLVKNKLA